MKPLKIFDLTQNKTLNVLIYEAFRKTIILGDIPAGTRINEKVFAEELNISRTPIRLAMKQLVNENLSNIFLKLESSSKVFVSKDAYEIYDIRKSLDTLATIKAMNQMTEADFQELQKTLLEQGEQYNEADEIELVLKISLISTHLSMKKSNARLKSIVLELQAYLVYFRDIAIRSTKRRDKALEEHWLIFRGMKTKMSNKSR